MISIIVAVSQNGVIGKDNKLLWNIPEDLKRFKEITSNHTIIMGRKTFESLPKVLPNRKHIVLTRDKNYKIDHEDVEIVHEIEHIVNKYKNSKEEVFIIGGAEIYKQFLPYASKIYLTIVFKDYEGDSHFYLGKCLDWITTEASDLYKTDYGLEYKFMIMKSVMSITREEYNELKSEISRLKQQITDLEQYKINNEIKRRD